MKANNPAYDDKAWENMELLLDKHLPQKKNGEGLFYFCFHLFWQGGASFLFFSKEEQMIYLSAEQKNTIVQPSSSVINYRATPVYIPLNEPSKQSIPGQPA